MDAQGDGILEPKPASSGESRATVYRPETDVAFQVIKLLDILLPPGIYLSSCCIESFQALLAE